MSKKKKVSVGYMGPPGSFANAAAILQFGKKADVRPMKSVEYVFLNVFRGDVDYGIALLENSFFETARRTLDLFVEFGLMVSAEIVLNPILHLMAKSKRTRVKRIYATEDVASLCHVLLKREMPDVDVQFVLTTSVAAELASRKRTCAAIAGQAAADYYDLEILRVRVQDDPDRYIRFLVIGREDAKPTGNDKTLMFLALIDRPGMLSRVLTPLKKYKLNVNRIATRPAYRSSWDHYAFLEIEGHRKSRPVKAALEMIKKRSEYCVVLGSFPKAEPIQV
jgi:chorismate mutase/prephenate dehydratase